MIGDYAYPLDTLERVLSEDGHVSLCGYKDLLISFVGKILSISFDPINLHVELRIVREMEENEKVVTTFYIHRNLGFATVENGLAVYGTFRIGRGKGQIYYLNNITL